MEPKNLPIVESRRTFIGQCAAALTGLTVVGCGGAMLQGCEATTSPPGNNSNQNGNNLVVDISSLATDGTSLITSQRGPDGKRILVVRNSATSYTAFSMECTHQQYEVSPPKDGIMTCAFHGSKFDITGAVRTGPATQPLESYATTLDSANQKLTVKLT